jgi:hypothetical protein
MPRLALAKDPVAKAPAIGCGLAPVFSQDPCRLQQSLQVEIGTRADYGGVFKRRSAPHRMRLGPVQFLDIVNLGKTGVLSGGT